METRIRSILGTLGYTIAILICGFVIGQAAIFVVAQDKKPAELPTATGTLHSEPIAKSPSLTSPAAKPASILFSPDDAIALNDAAKSEKDAQEKIEYLAVEIAKTVIAREGARATINKIIKELPQGATLVRNKDNFITGYVKP